MTNKYTVLHIITQGGPWGGAQKYIYDILQEAPENFEIQVAIGEINGEKSLQDKLKGNISFHQLNYLRRKISILNDILAIFEISSIYNKKKPDIIHLHSTKAGIIGSFAKIFSRTKAPIVYTAHGWVFNEKLSSWKKYIYVFLERITSRLKSKIIVLSKEDLKTAVNILGINDEKLVIIPVGINTAECNSFTKQEAYEALYKKTKIKIDKNLFWIVVIANFYKTKSLDTFIFALSKLRSNNIGCVIFGKGPEEEKITKIVKDNKMENSIFLVGFVENASKFLPAFDLFVLPSAKEGLPYTILEAQSQKIPVIATKVGGIPSIIEDKKTGFLVKSGDAVSLAETILFASKNKDLANCIAENAFNNIQNKYSLKKMISEITLVYDLLLSASDSCGKKS